VRSRCRLLRMSAAPSGFRLRCTVAGISGGSCISCFLLSWRGGRPGRRNISGVWGRVAPHNIFVLCVVTPRHRGRGRLITQTVPALCFTGFLGACGDA
jgi:hypothetical protein